MITTREYLSSLDVVQTGAVIAALGSGYQLCVEALHGDVVPAIFILATYARLDLDMELVDDYELLVERQRAAFLDYCHHPLLYLASCTCILHARGDTPSLQAFTDVGVDRVFADLVDADEE